MAWFGFIGSNCEHQVNVIADAEPWGPVLETRTRALKSEGNIAGLAVAVVRKSGMVAAKGYGCADFNQNRGVDGDTGFRLASSSKTLIATALLQQVQRGQLDLNANVNQYLPFPVASPFAPTDPITTLELANHTSAIIDNWDVLNSLYVDGDSPVSLRGFDQNYLAGSGIWYHQYGNFTANQPGAVWCYSNAGSALAALVAQSVGKKEFAALTRDTILRPLEMDQSAWFLHDLDGEETANLATPYVYREGSFVPERQLGFPFYPVGQLRATLPDMSNFIAMMLDGGKYKGERVLSRESVRYINTYAADVDTGFPGLEQSFVWFRYLPADMVYLNGSSIGVTTLMGYLIGQNPRVGVVILTNSSTDGGGSQILAIWRIAQLLLQKYTPDRLDFSKDPFWAISGSPQPPDRGACVPPDAGP
jgi:CubicO group peptidase (beta-lactamase class C family)